MKLYLVAIIMMLFVIGLIINKRQELMLTLKLHTLTIEKSHNENALKTTNWQLKHHQSYWGRLNPRMVA